MSDGTAIEWTDATWNPIIGCSVVSPGCTNCYAMRLAGTRLKDHPSRKGLTIDSKAGPVWNGQVRLLEDKLREPLRWTRPRRIFVCAHADLFADQVPDAWIDKVFATIEMTRRAGHIYQILTKRPERARAYFKARFRLPDNIMEFYREPGEPLGVGYQPPANVHLGVSVEDQARADERIPILLDTPAAVRWISAEPLLGPLTLTHIHGQGDLTSGPHEQWWGSCLNGRRYHAGGDGDFGGYPKLDWVVVGGESGPGSRPMHPDWVKRIRDDCAAASVPFLFKQWGNWMPISQMGEGATDALYHPAPKSRPEARRTCKVAAHVLHTDGERFGFADPGAFLSGKGAMSMFEIGKKAAGRLLDGVEHNAMPGEPV